MSTPADSIPSEAPGTGASRDFLGPYGLWPYVDRRSREDRRARRTRMFSRFSLHGDREGGRRRGEGVNTYVDRHPARDVVLCLAILALNILDAGFTLLYLMQGGLEANPLAQMLLDQGSVFFTFGKAVVVAFCVVFLLTHRLFRYVRPALYFLLVFYSLLLVYHLYLQFGLAFRTV